LKTNIRVAIPYLLLSFYFYFSFRGSFSIVFKGFSQHEPVRSVAIKEINYSLLSKQQSVNVNNEMNILSQLQHESIVRLYSVYSSGEKKFLITEYLRGGQLLNAICKREFYRESDARRLLFQITSALVYLHDRRVIHRDIKPENIILADHSLESAVKLVDFGFATIETDALKRPSSQLVGSPGYFAPEVLKDRSYSTKCDIWSLGVVFYIILSGLMPFPTESGEEHRILVRKIAFYCNKHFFLFFFCFSFFLLVG
jgi:serine/threonine protein kinase